MTTAATGLYDDTPPEAAPEVPTKPRDDFGRQLRRSSAAVRLRRDRLGVRRALQPAQLQLAAAAFDADSKLMSASKKLLDTKHDAYRAVLRAMAVATEYWRAMTVPFPEDGVRLIPRDKIKDFEEQMAEHVATLAGAAKTLEAEYTTMQEDARKRLGDLYDPDDYLSSIVDEFAISWDYPSFDPPAYLKDISPALYQQQAERLQRRFDEAVELAEAAFISEFSKLVAHLADRLTGEKDGKPKTFRDSSITKLREFFDRFGQLNIGSNEAFDAIVTDARKLLGDTQPEQLRDDLDLRAHIAKQLTGVQEKAAAMMTDLPTRAISLEDDE